MPSLSAKEIGLLRYAWRSLSWRLQTGLLNQELSFILPTGISFPLPADSPLAREIYLTQCNVDGNAAYIIARYLQEQSVDGEPGDFFDIGANIGYYTALISPLVRRSYAFEPDQGHHTFLSPLLITTGNARLVAQAVSNFNGPGALHISGEADHSHLVEELGTPGTTEVEVTTLDEFCRSHPDAFPAVVKIDVEGYEVAVLEGAQRITQQFKPLFCMEFAQTPGRPNDPTRLQKFLTATKYTAYTLAGSDRYRLQSWLPGATPLPASLKMLFLVPPGDRFFSSLAAKWPIELQHIMRSAQIHEYLGTSSAL